MSQCRSTDGTSTKPSIGNRGFMTGKGMLCTTCMLKPLSREVSISKLLSGRKYMTSGILDSISGELYGVLNLFKHALSSLPGKQHSRNEYTVSAITSKSNDYAKLAPLLD